MSVPVLETARLRLRAYRTTDLDDCAAMWADPVVVRHFGARPLRREECWAKILKSVGHWALLGFGYWAIEEKESGRFVGEAGLADGKREMTPPIVDPEIGWALASWAHGVGFATEAARAGVAWGEERFPGAPTVCIIDPANTASVHVAEKCGYVQIARTEYYGEPILLFRR